MDPMKIAITGLNSFNRAISTTTHNIANAYTEGYTRQRADIQSNYPQFRDGSFVGSGSHVAQIDRLADKFTTNQIRTLSSENERLNTFTDLSSRVDGLLAEDNASLTPALQSFFNSLEQLNTDPSSVQNRDVVMSEARLLVDRFNTLDQQISQEYNAVNSRIGAEVNEINSLTANLSELNTSISTSQGQGAGAPPDLLDQRDQLLEELAKHVSVNVMEQADGQVNVYAGNGIGLVINGEAKTLETMPNANDASQVEIGIDGFNMSKNVQGGRLGGLMDFRREMLDPSRRELGRLATVLGNNFNAQHAKGVDLKSNPGQAFFTTDKPGVLADSANTGNASLAVAFTDVNQLTGANYQIDYDGAQYQIRNLDEDTVATTATLPTTIDGFEISLTSGSIAAGDSFTVQPTAYGARNFGLSITSGREIAAASPVRGSAQISNLGSGVIDSLAADNVSNAALTNPAAITFDSATTYSIYDNSTTPPTNLGSGSYTPGDVISANGWSTKITGQPEAGDTFNIEFNQSATADNTNSSLLSALQFENTVGGSSTYQESYSNLINQVGTVTRQATISRDSKTTLLDQAIATRDSISGVNLDEEAINLAKYQQAYEAAAKVIATSRDLFQTILNATQR